MLMNDWGSGTIGSFRMGTVAGRDYGVIRKWNFQPHPLTSGDLGGAGDGATAGFMPIEW